MQGRFLALLQQEESVLEDLHTLLKQEMDALKSRNTNLIHEILESKNVVLNRLGMLDKQRQLYIEDENNTLVNDNSFLNQINNMSSKIKSSLDKCKHQNKINGGIIEMSQLFNEKILDIMQGNNDKGKLYSAKGKSESNHSQHSIARV